MKSTVPRGFQLNHQFADKLKLCTMRQKRTVIRGPASLTPIIRAVALFLEDSNPPSFITLYRWLKDYHHSGGDIRSLIPRHGAKGNYNPKIAPEVHQLISEVVREVYLNPSRPSIASIYDVIICRILGENSLRKSLGQVPLKIPHRSTIYRQIEKLDPIDKAMGRICLGIKVV